jgi:CRP/FNR family transcriptional regulator, anaerobic regulatory protein
VTTRGELRTPSVEDAPSLRAITFGPASGANPVRLLTAAQRQQVASIATRVRLRPRAVVYREGTNAGWVFTVASGVVKSFRDLPSGRRRIATFLFPEDIFGLAENGNYVNTAQAITEVRLYRIPLDPLERLLLEDSRLQLQFLCKVTHALRQAQRQKIVLTRRDAVGRVAMFLSMLERRAGDTRSTSTVSVPMSRSDVASYLGLSLEAVSRATAALARRHTISFVDRHTVRIVDRGRFDKLVADV